jgi:hypothetical protein
MMINDDNADDDNADDNIRHCITASAGSGISVTSAATQAPSIPLPLPAVPPLKLNFQKPNPKCPSALPKFIPTPSPPRLELEIIRQQQVFVHSFCYFRARPSMCAGADRTAAGVAHRQYRRRATGQLMHSCPQSCAVFFNRSVFLTWSHSIDLSLEFAVWNTAH